MVTLSAVIVAHNEEKNIRGCLESLYFADEIVVVLDKCTDDTRKIVEEFTDKIVEGSWNLEGARRNVAHVKATGDLVLEIDADERISEGLAKEIIAVKELKGLDPCGFVAPIDNYIGDRCVKYGWMRTLGVIGRQTMAHRGLKLYHEDKEVHPTCEFKGEIRFLKNPIIHLVDENIFDLIARFNRYTTWKANDMIFTGKISGGGVFKGILNLKIRFIKSFFLKRGYREGMLGIILAILAGLYPTISYIKAMEKLKLSNADGPNSSSLDSGKKLRKNENR